MENKRDVLSKKYVLENGINFDEELWFTSSSDEVLDKPEEKNGKPFTGLAYELHDNGTLAYYCYYRDGFKEGNYVKFYQSGKVKTTDYMIKGQTRGIRKKWYECEVLKYEGEFKFGICLHYTEWDKHGDVISKKVAPTKEELTFINRCSKREDNPLI